MNITALDAVGYTAPQHAGAVPDPDPLVYIRNRFLLHSTLVLGWVSCR